MHAASDQVMLSMMPFSQKVDSNSKYEKKVYYHLVHFEDTECKCEPNVSYAGRHE